VICDEEREKKKLRSRPICFSLFKIFLFFQDSAVFGCPLERQCMAPDAQLKERNLIKIKQENQPSSFSGLLATKKKDEEENNGHVVFKSNIGGLAGK
jgi:hypothetical protein